MISAADSSALLDQFVDQRDLVLLEGAAVAHEAQRAGHAARRGGDAHLQAQRPHAPLADLDRPRGPVAGRRGPADHRRRAGISAPPIPGGVSSGAGPASSRRPAAASSASTEPCRRISSSPLELQLGRERVAEPTDGGLQASPLVLDELEPMVGLVDALAAVAGQQPQQEHQRKDEQDRARSPGARPWRPGSRAAPAQASTAHTSAMTRICSLRSGTTPASRIRAIEPARSTMHPAANAAPSSGS